MSSDADPTTMFGNVFGVDDAATPDRQIAMVIDLNKCMGCQTCSVSCKTLWTGGEGQKEMWWNKVNTMPGEGSPKGWEDMGGGFTEEGRKFSIWRFLGGRMNDSELPTTEEFGEYVDVPHEDIVSSAEGRHTSAPDEGPEWMYNWDEDRGAGKHPNQYFFYLPRLCNHCTRPACLEACPRDAIYKREEDGIVLVDEEDCNGYRFCVEACPYKVIYFNPEEGTVAMGTDDGVEFTADISGAVVSADGGSRRVPPDGEGGGIAQKCIGCFPRIEKGVAPACVRQCPGRARFYGYLDEEGTPVHELVREWEVALPLHPEYNTEPNVYYVPPLSSPRLDEEGKPTGERRIPQDYLEDLFGEEVGDALETLREEREKVKNGGDSELMDLLIGYEWPDDFFGSFTENPLDAKEPRSGDGGGEP